MVATKRLNKIAEGREAEMFEWEDGKILRLQRSPDSRAEVKLQVMAIEAASKFGLRVPVVYGETTEMGRPGLIMERLNGTDMLTLIGKQPWKLVWVARVCSELQARLHDAMAGPEIVPLKQRIRSMIESSDEVPEKFAEFVLKELDELPDGDRLLHGDFHPGNVMMHGDEPVLIDWANVSRGDPAADFARTRLMLRIGKVPPWSPLHVRVIAPVARGLLWWLYDRGYRRRRSLDMSIVGRWETVRIADWLAGESAEEDRPALLKLAEEKLSAV